LIFGWQKRCDSRALAWYSLQLVRENTIPSILKKLFVHFVFIFLLLTGYYNHQCFQNWFHLLYKVIKNAFIRKMDWTFLLKTLNQQLYYEEGWTNKHFEL